MPIFDENPKLSRRIGWVMTSPVMLALPVKRKLAFLDDVSNTNRSVWKDLSQRTRDLIELAEDQIDEIEIRTGRPKSIGRHE